MNSSETIVKAAKAIVLNRGAIDQEWKEHGHTDEFERLLNHELTLFEELKDLIYEEHNI